MLSFSPHNAMSVPISIFHDSNVLIPIIVIYLATLHFIVDDLVAPRVFNPSDTRTLNTI